VIGHGLCPAGILAECRHRDLQTRREPRDQWIDRLLHVRECDTGMSQQRKLHGEAQAVCVPAPLAQAGAIKVFTDVRSGRTMEQRPGLDALLAYARDGDTVAVVRLDRLGRSLAELLATVASLKERGIGLVSLEEKIDTNSAAGELVFHVFGAIAHFERRLIAERTKDGIAAARARGKRPGRQPLDADKIAAALKLVDAGLSPTAAAKQVGLGRSTVYREVNRAGTERLPQPA